jgi:hypothetical protein
MKYASWRIRSPIDLILDGVATLRAAAPWRWAALVLLVLLFALTSSGGLTWEGLKAGLVRLPIFLFLLFYMPGTGVSGGARRLEKFESANAFLVDLHLKVLSQSFDGGHETYGSDQGLVRFEGDSLVFQGLRTSFRVPRAELLIGIQSPDESNSTAKQTDYSGSHRTRQAWSARLARHPHIKLDLRSISHKNSPGFEETFYAWLQRNEAQESAEATLPPLSVGGAAVLLNPYPLAIVGGVTIMLTVTSMYAPAGFPNLLRPGYGLFISVLVLVLAAAQMRARSKVNAALGRAAEDPEGSTDH